MPADIEQRIADLSYLSAGAGPVRRVGIVGQPVQDSLAGRQHGRERSGDLSAEEWGGQCFALRARWVWIVGQPFPELGREERMPLLVFGNLSGIRDMRACGRDTRRSIQGADGDT